MKKKIKKISIWVMVLLLIVMLPFLIYLFNFRVVVFNTAFHEAEFEKIGVYDKFPDQDVKAINRQVVGYLNNKDVIQEGFFNQKEMSHFRDVKNLIQGSISFLYFLFFVFIILIFSLYFILRDSKKFIRYKSIILISGSLVILLSSLVFISTMNTNFTGFFDNFHNLFFEPGTWTFDASTENMVNLYPEEFFYDMGYKISILSFSVSLVLLIFGILGMVLSRKKK